MDEGLTILRDFALASALVWTGVEVAGRGRRWIPALGAWLLLAMIVWRGVQVGFLPLSNKYESFVGFAAILLGVGAWRHGALARPGRVLLGVLAAGFLAGSMWFDPALRYPSPLLYTRWYLAHVPVSFLGYALWLASAGDALDHLLGRTETAVFRRRQEANVRAGLLWFSAAMIFGGVWGLISWGAWFLWDPKIVWSVLAWLYYAALVHLPYGPFKSRRLRVGLGLAGLLLVLFTYVGTSFMPGIHAL
jgi:ABC-type transport system involved in cytochrome c biogenesis permease subunit